MVAKKRCLGKVCVEARRGPEGMCVADERRCSGKMCGSRDKWLSYMEVVTVEFCVCLTSVTIP